MIEIYLISLKIMKDIIKISLKSNNFLIIYQKY